MGNNNDDSGYNPSSAGEEDNQSNRAIANEEGDDNEDGNNAVKTQEQEEEDEASPASSSSGVKWRQRFSLQQMMKLVQSIQKKMTMEGVLQRAAAAHFNVGNKQIICWKKQMSEMKTKHNLKAKLLTHGPASSLDSIENELLQFIFALQEQAVGVTISMVVVKAAQLKESFCDKSSDAQYHAARCFVCCHWFVH